MRYRLLLLLAAGIVGAVVLLRPRPGREAPTRDSAVPPAERPEGVRPVGREVAGAGPVAAPAERVRSTNWIEQLRNGEGVKLTAAQINTFLEANHRNADSLLAAARAGDDLAYLREAKERFPNDPRVQFTAIFKSDSPEERRQWLDRLKQSAPDNSLPEYLSALDDLKAGRAEQGVRDLTAAAGKTGYQDYVLDSIQNAEEAYRSAGYPEAEAKLVATTEALLPQLAQLKQLSVSMVDLASSYRQAGDTASEQNLLQMAIRMGQQLDPNGPGGQFLINNLVGIAIQLNAFKAMDPASPYGSSGQTVQNCMDQLTQERASIKEAGKQTEAMWESMPPEEMVSFFDREKLYGEQAALRWYLNKSGPGSGAGPNY